MSDSDCESTLRRMVVTPACACCWCFSDECNVVCRASVGEVIASVLIKFPPFLHENKEFVRQ